MEQQKFQQKRSIQLLQKQYKLSYQKHVLPHENNNTEWESPHKFRESTKSLKDVSPTLKN